MSKKRKRYESSWFAICSNKGFRHNFLRDNNHYYNEFKHYIDGNNWPKFQICTVKLIGVRTVKSLFDSNFAFALLQKGV